jgi:hypothetical protein
MMVSDLEMAQPGPFRHGSQFSNRERRATGLRRVMSENGTAEQSPKQ